jgi:4-aminobutyrate aminotransferase-like enzyme
VAAALANLRYLLKHQGRLLANANKPGAYSQDRLSHMKFKSSATVRAMGPAIGVKFGAAGYAAKPEEKCLRAGLRVNADDDVLLLFVPLNPDPATAEAGSDNLDGQL